MSVKKLETLMKFLSSNPETTTKLKDLAGAVTDKAQKVIGNIVSPSPSPSISPLSIINKQMISDTSLNIAKIIITIALVSWAIFMIVSRFTIKDPETKENYSYINTILFGSLGIIPMILCVWILIILIINILPQINSTLHNSNSFMTSINNIIGRIFN